MEVATIRALQDNFVYALVDGQRCALVDPGEAEPVQRFLDQTGLTVTHVLLTHHHPDHVAAAATFGGEIWCSEIDRPRLPFATRGLVDGERVDVAGVPFEIIATPGHTRGQIAYYTPGRVFTGDTLFSGGCGRLFEGTAAEMHRSLRRLAALPPDTRVYFGHEYTRRNLEFIAAHLSLAKDPSALAEAVASYRATLDDARSTTPSTIARELEVNPFLAARSTEEFARWREARNHW